VITSLKYADADAHIMAFYQPESVWLGRVARWNTPFVPPGTRASKASGPEQVLLYGADGKIEQLMPEQQDVFAAQLKHFAARIKNPSVKPVCPCEDSYTVMNLLSARKRSAETAEAVRF
jgi:hypothetical protein